MVQQAADAKLSATYAFEITDGAGNIYASFTGNDILDIQSSITQMQRLSLSC